ncbi:AraC family transcriptional regulator ligand-binding domain-containing protein [Streptomyces sp. NPDC051704]|uniref:AraC family transcriptional regulator n=1 Tax=Streptomyces sp. NPDC051704 TaxID=3365671 RepID=UPI0037B3C04E
MPSIEPSTVAASYARAVLNATTDAADAEAGPGAWASPLARLPFTEVRALWDTVIGTGGGDPYAGLRVGDAITPGSLHVLGHVVLTSASLAEAAEAAVRYHSLVSQAGTVTAHRGSETTRIRYRPTVAPASMHPQQVEAVVAGMVRAARWIAGDDWAPASASFTHTRTGSAEPYARILGCPVAFDAAENAITVGNRDLDRPRAPHDPELGALHRAYADRLLRELSTSVTLAERVRQWLDHAPLDGAGPADAGRDVHLSTRSLRRALQEEGTSWRALLDEARHRRTRRLLETTDLPLDRIALLVGLSGATALVRAFGRWEGVTPGTYRARSSGAAGRGRAAPRVPDRRGDPDPGPG